MAVKIRPISDLRRSTGDVLNQVEENKEVYITQYGHPVAVLMSYEHYEQLRAELDALKSQLRGTERRPPVSVSYTERLAGLHQEVWEGIDTDAYLRTERDAWEDSGQS